MASQLTATRQRWGMKKKMKIKFIRVSCMHSHTQNTAVISINTKKFAAELGLTCVRLVVAMRFPPWSWNTLRRGRGSPLPDLTRSRCSPTLASADSRVTPSLSRSIRSVMRSSISRRRSSSFSSCVGSFSASSVFLDLTSSLSFLSILAR